MQPLPEALNPMRSAGIWQFIPATARRWGLRVEATHDERMDPARAAEAAADYLVDLHREFDDGASPSLRTTRASKKFDRRSPRTARATRSHSWPPEASRYASAVMAAALLVHAPGMLD